MEVIKMVIYSLYDAELCQIIHRILEWFRRSFLVYLFSLFSNHPPSFTKKLQVFFNYDDAADKTCIINNDNLDHNYEHTLWLFWV